jgi:hypothetical protein
LRRQRSREFRNFSETLCLPAGLPPGARRRALLRERPPYKTIEREIREFLIDDALSRSTKLRRLNNRALRAQQVLRRLVDDPAWSAYLDLEAATNARAAKEVRHALQRLLDVFAYVTLDLGSRR